MVAGALGCYESGPVVGDSVRTGDIFRAVTWFILVDLALLALFWFVPAIVTTLPAVLG